jgi:membrane protease YdiL (CAAX protease family)
MLPLKLFFNDVGRLRSGWRIVVFAVAYLLFLSLIGSALYMLHLFVPMHLARRIFGSNWGFPIQALLLLTGALVVGWVCSAGLEGLPFRVLGWALYRGWWRDWLLGSLLGAATMILATGICTMFGGFQFRFNAAGMMGATLQTLFLTAILFIFAASAEEALFRGYPLQTLARANLVWTGIVLTGVWFGVMHLRNPNVTKFTFINTALAGVWLAVGYYRTRSLWFPLGLHWCWNWTMGAVLGLPVSGLLRLAPNPLLRGVDRGPAWLTGGAYGIEGGAACIIAVVISSIFIWRTTLLSATEEMKRLTDGENPVQPLPSVNRASGESIAHSFE